MALILPSAQRGLSLATWLLRTSGRRTAASAFSVSLDLCFQSRTGTLSYASPSRDPPFHIFKRIQLGLPGMGGMVGGSEWRKESKGLTHSFHFLRFFFFLMWTILKVFIEFVTILFLFYVLVFGCKARGILAP